MNGNGKFGILIGVRIDPNKLSAFDATATKLGLSRSAALRKSIEMYISGALGAHITLVDQPTKDRAKEMIRDYLKKNARAWTCDIAEHLRLDREFVQDCIGELKREGRVRVYPGYV